MKKRYTGRQIIGCLRETDAGLPSEALYRQTKLYSAATARANPTRLDRSGTSSFAPRKPTCFQTDRR